MNIPFAVLEDSDFLGVELEIPEVTRWSGLVGVNENVESYDNSRPRRYTAATVDVEPLEMEIRRGFKLKLDTTWHVEGPPDRRTLSTPLVVETSTRTPKPWHDHLVP